MTDRPEVWNGVNMSGAPQEAATGLTTRTMLLPFLRHSATCVLQAVRDNAPWDESCSCGLRERWLAIEEGEVVLP